MKAAGGTGPPAIWSLTALLLFVFTVAMVLRGGPGANLLGFFSGAVIGTGNLAVWLVSDNKRRATKKWTDWPIPSKPVITCTALASWTLGAWNVFFWALEVTRGA